VGVGEIKVLFVCLGLEFELGFAPVKVEPDLQSILLLLFLEMGVFHTICPRLPRTSIFLISASQVAGITGVSH
jgi:hypothetical protein